jgi:hypothetical protein
MVDGHSTSVSYPLEVRGLYCIGEYDDSITRIYPQEQLWLAYPADSGKKWLHKTDPLRDTDKVCRFLLRRYG